MIVRGAIPCARSSDAAVWRRSCTLTGG
jgi:hypothetical protein